ncbi:hypothetical short chain dehydrogenase [Janibacter sp. HTCC2649]|nr:hypothetical short chain dehydrogenase [Janibacter sp. HTCC2649]
MLVTGASSGIGEATAYEVARQGAHVHLLARRGEELRRVRDTIEAAGGDAVVHVCDLTDAAEVDALAVRLNADHGGVDYLVNNAGRSIRRSLDLSYDRFHDVERTMAVNYFGAVGLTLAVLPAMRDQGFGHVVNVTSWGVQKKQPKFSPRVEVGARHMGPHRRARDLCRRGDLHQRAVRAGDDADGGDGAGCRGASLAQSRPGRRDRGPRSRRPPGDG